MKKSKDIVERFFERVEKSENCWIWLGARKDSGYGNFHLGNLKYRRAHKFSWEMHFGKVPDGLLVLHKCDNPICVKPNHLFLGNQKENMADAKKKGRNAFGVKNGRSKLTDEIVKEIRKEYAFGRASSRNLGQKYSVGKSTILQIIRGNTWKHI